MSTVQSNSSAEQVAAPQKPKNKGKLKFLLLGIVVLVVLIAMMSSGSPKAIQLQKTYIDQSANSSDIICLFENTSDKPVEAFKGVLRVYDKFDKVNTTIPFDWTTAIPAKSKIYLCYTTLDGRINKIEADDLARVAKARNATVQQFEVTQKYDFKCEQAVQK